MGLQTCDLSSTFSQVVFKPPTNQKALSVREIKAGYLGKLVTLQGIVTRVTAVKPYVEVAAYTCESCGSENFQEVTGRQFMPLTECNSQVCKTNQTKGKLHEQTRANKFLEFQEVKIQELVRHFTSRSGATSRVYGRASALTDNITCNNVLLDTSSSGRTHPSLNQGSFVRRDDQDHEPR